MIGVVAGSSDDRAGVACGAMELLCRTITVGVLPTLVVSGELDLATVPVLQSALARLIGEAAGTTIAVDLDGLTVVDDSGLGVLLGAAGRARQHGGDLVIICTSARLIERFDLSGLSRAIEIRQRLNP